MEFIIHRVNSIKVLKKIPKEYGCEIDIRTKGSRLVLNHDPYKGGDSLIDYLDVYMNKTLVLNIKESGIENDVLFEVKKRNIESYFLLDVEQPYLFNASLSGERNIALRFSEYEPLENIYFFKNKFDWIWVDTVNSLPLTKFNLEVLKGHKICIVCPSRWGNIKIDELKNELINLNYQPDYIMTELKLINEWI